MKRRTVAAAVIVVLACAAGGTGWYIWNRQNASDSENQVYVTTVGTLMGDVSGTQNRYAGIVEPQRTVDVKVDSGRKIKDVKVKEGDAVAKGTVLFEYDESANEDALAQARLDLDRYINEAKSLESQLKTLQEDKAKASADEQLSYTIEIRTTEMDLKKNEYDQKSKQAEIDKLNGQSGNLAVTSEIDGIVKKVNESVAGTDSDDALDSDNEGGSSGSESFITIVATGTYRVKGKVNETNVSTFEPGTPVIVRSRVDADQTWTGVLDSVDTKNQDNSGENQFDMMDSSDADEQTASTDYPFYVSLDSAEGLILGQHVYIELDNGQGIAKSGIWLDEFYLEDVDGEPWVWASSERDRLEKRPVTLGEYDEELGKYQILEGLTKNDCIAFPEETLEEGMHTTTDDSAQLPTGLDSDSDSDSDMDFDSGFDSSLDSSLDGNLDSDSDSDSDGTVEIKEEVP